MIWMLRPEVAKSLVEHVDIPSVDMFEMVKVLNTIGERIEVGEHGAKTMFAYKAAIARIEDLESQGFVRVELDLEGRSRSVHQDMD